MTNNQRAVEFLHLIMARRIDEAYDRFVDMTGKHHNPYFGGGFDALKEGMIEAHRKFPDTRIQIKNVIAEGELVAVHSNVVMTPGERGVAVVHLFRFRGDKIVEMWDVGQPVPADSPNKNGMF